MPQKVEISHKTVVFTVLFLVSLWLIVQIREIIFLVFVSFILMSAFNPLTELLEKIRIPRFASVLLIYLCLVTFLGFIGSTILPPFITQTVHLGEKMPEYISTIFPAFQFDFNTLSQQIAPIGENLVKVTIGIFSNLITLFTIFVVSFYFLMERQYLEKHTGNFLGKDQAKKLIMIVAKVEEKLGAWVRGEMTLALTIGLMTFAGLTFLGLPYILSLSLLAAIFEIIPIVGPIISAVPAVLIALTISPLLASATVITYFIIQQVEAHLVVPMVIQRAVGLPPVVSIIALMVGGKLAGITGALLAVPVVISVETILSEYLKSRQIEVD